jgi:hypothetical protein
MAKENLRVTFTDISEWQKNIHYSTGGTRSKYVALNPSTNEEFFFKGSKETESGEIRYSSEFWSEIVSSKVGQYLGFPLLDYNIAFDKNHNQKIGCLSKSMITNSQTKLTEGKTYLTGFNPSYNPEKDKNDYTFQFICNALNHFKLNECIEKIIEIIVFDSVIGNSDRHQENWGILTSFKIKNNDDINNASSKKNIKTLISNFSKKTKNKDGLAKSSEIIFEIIFEFAPIYDSGCCLGREYVDSKIELMLKNTQMIEAYVKKGESEIHWDGFVKKRKHFELIELLLIQYPKETTKFISKIKTEFDPNEIKKIIHEIDSNLPKDLINFKLSDIRKEFMCKLITLRTEKLLKLL